MKEKVGILIVDDNESNRRTLTLILEKMGYKIETAGTGQEALEKARGRFFNLALVDIKLPDMEGVELIAPLREMHPEMAAIMITAYASLETAVKALNEGALAYIIKPVNVDEVLATIREILEKQRLVKEKRQAEEALRQSEKRFGDIADNALVWIWEVDPNGRYTYANPMAEKILGYKPEEILEKHFYDLFHPEDREELKKAAFDAFARKTSFREFINRNVHKSGKTVWLSTSGVPMLDEKGNLIGYRGADTDITERKQAEGALRASEEKYRLVVENAAEGIVLLDIRGTILEINKRALEISGFKREELLGKSFMKILSRIKMNRRSIASAFQKVLAGKITGETEWKFVNLRGKEIIIHARPAFIKEGGKKRGVTVLIEDITGRKQAEEAIRKAEEQYRQVIENILEFVPDGLLVFTDKLNLFRTNKAFREIVQKYSAKLNYQEDELAKRIIEQVKKRVTEWDYAEIRIPKRKNEKTKNK